MVNDQVAHSRDIVVQIEKNLKAFYETEFVIYYVLGFYQNNYKELGLKYCRDFDLYFSPARKKISISTEFSKLENVIKIVIVIPNNLDNIETIVNCNLMQEDDGLIKFKNYQIEKRNH